MSPVYKTVKHATTGRLNKHLFQTHLKFRL